MCLYLGLWRGVAWWRLGDEAEESAEGVGDTDLV